jgi:hypothetical protein
MQQPLLRLANVDKLSDSDQRRELVKNVVGQGGPPELAGPLRAETGGMADGAGGKT